MTRSTVTPMLALKRLADIVRQLDAAECPALYNQIQGELAVADMMVRDWVEPTAQPAIVAVPDQVPVAHDVMYDGESCGNIFLTMKRAEEHKRHMDLAYPDRDRVIRPLYAAPQPEPAQRDVIVMRVNGLEVARAALNTAEYAIKGREHTGFIHKAIAAIDAEIAKEKQ